MSQEMALALDEMWGVPKEWHDTLIMDDVVMWITRLSNIVFLGETFTRNKNWIRVTAMFTTNLFTAIAATRLFHPALRPLVDLFSPLNRRVRKDQAAVVAMLKPVLDQRRNELRAAEKEGRKPELPDDSIEWFRSSANGRTYPEIWIQLGLVQVAIQTTSDLMCQTVLNICAYPEYVEPLRQEIIEVLGTRGLSKEGLAELRLLDSFIKETQRLKPVSMASMHRRAMKDVELPGGIRIQEGEHLAISSHLMWDEGHYDNPDKFNGYRFSDRRKGPGHEAKNLLVSTSSDHLGFAHGKLACPGRFLAANMLKVAMLHLLLKYDMKIDNPAEAKWWTYGENMLPKQSAKVWIRSRTPEVDLEALTAAL
jgi:cytochrome P450